MVHAYSNNIETIQEARLACMMHPKQNSSTLINFVQHFTLYFVAETIYPQVIIYTHVFITQH